MKDSESTLVAAFERASDARLALRALRHHGLSDKKVGVLARTDDGETEFKSFKELEKSHVEEGAAVGVAAGAGGGALWGLAIALGAVPAIGPVIGGGLLVAVVASAASGAVAGGVIGALIGVGIPDEDAAYYEGELQKGHSILVAKADTPEEAELARGIFKQHRAYEQRAYRTASRGERKDELRA